MSSNWRLVLNNYLTDFEAQTSTVLEHINELLLKSGQKFDNRIRSYVVKSVNSRLEQTLEFFDIQIGSQVGENGECTTGARSNHEKKGNIAQMNSGVPSEEVEVINVKVESLSSDDDETVKNAEGVSSSSSHLAEADDTQRFERNVCRPSLDSIISERQSICSPSTSNQPMMFTTLSPIDTSESSPNESFGSNCEDIKQEPDGSEDEIIFYQEEPEECVVKMEDIPTDPIMEMSRENNEIQSTSYDQSWRDRPMSPIEPQSLKRQHSSDVRSKTFKRQKTTEEPQLKEPSSNIDKNIVFACYYCYHRTSLFVDTFTEVYDHWESNHGPNPFRFLAFGMAACVYCDKVDVFSNLQNHHKHSHHTEIFIVVDRQNKSKCGLCHQIFPSSSQMIDHFKTHHDPSQYMFINNPICFTQSEMEQLINLNIYKGDNEANQIEGFICGHCKKQKNISEITFMNHIEKDKFEYPCSHSHAGCKFMGNSIQETVQHELSEHNLTRDVSKHVNMFMGRLGRHFLRTQVIFTNGLVLYKHNMLSTTFDDRKEFWPFKERLAKRKLNECTRNDKQPETDSVFRKNELEKLRSKRNHLRITGIIGTTDQLPGIFLQICKAIGMTAVSKDDIEDIYRCSSGVIVILVTRGLKSDILKTWYTTPKNIILNKLASVSNLQPFINSSKISITRELTPFFIKLWHYAETAKKQKQIHTFWVTDKGLKVLPSRDCDTKLIVWSKTDLEKCFQGI